MRMLIFPFVLALVFQVSSLLFMEFDGRNKRKKELEKRASQPYLSPTWEFEPQPGMIEEDYEWVKAQLSRGWMNVSQTPNGEIFASPWMPKSMPVQISKAIVDDVVHDYVGTERPRLKDQVRPEQTLFLGSPNDARKLRPPVRTPSRTIHMNQAWLNKRSKELKHKKKTEGLSEREEQLHAVVNHLRKEQEFLRKESSQLKDQIEQLEDSVLPY